MTGRGWGVGVRGLGGGQLRLLGGWVGAIAWVIGTSRLKIFRTCRNSPCRILNKRCSESQSGCCTLRASVCIFLGGTISSSIPPHSPPIPPSLVDSSPLTYLFLATNTKLTDEISLDKLITLVFVILLAICFILVFR